MEDLSRSELPFTPLDALDALAKCVATTGFSLEEATEAMRRLGSVLASTIEEKNESVIQYSGIYAIVRGSNVDKKVEKISGLVF